MLSSCTEAHGDRNLGSCSCFRLCRALLRHCFGAYPAPGGTAVFCFGLRPPLGSRFPKTNLPLNDAAQPCGRFLLGPSEKADLGLGSRALSHGFAQVCPEQIRTETEK